MSDQELSELAAAWDEIGDAFAAAERGFAGFFVAVVRGTKCFGLCVAAAQFRTATRRRILGVKTPFAWPTDTDEGRAARVEFCRRMAKQYRERMEAAK
jgi:hypothetical protein